MPIIHKEIIVLRKYLFFIATPDISAIATKIPDTLDRGFFEYMIDIIEYIKYIMPKIITVFFINLYIV